MADKNGNKTGGRKKGTPNKATLAAREAIANFVDGNAERLEGWLEAIAQEEGAKAAFQCFTSVLEYHVPKLARSELSGDPNNPIQHTHELLWMREALAKRKG